MDQQAIEIYCICDEVIKCFGIVDDPQCKMSTCEVMTFALLSATHFCGEYKKTRLASIACRYFSKILSFSRLVRSIHIIPEYIWMTVFAIQKMFLVKPEAKLFIIDSLPIQAYGNHKSYRAKIFKGKLYHGYIASKKTYFFGIKIHMIIDENGVPIEFCFTPGSMSDMEGIKNLDCEIPSGSVLIGDKAYTNYSLEDDLLEMK